MKEDTLWGIPVVISDEVPEGECYMGRFPTVEEVQEHGSFEKALEAQAKNWVKIKNLDV